MPGYQNTAIAKYNFTTTVNSDAEDVIEKVECPIASCAHHLENHDDNYVFCNGGCHGVPDEEIRRKIDEQPR